MSTPVGFKVSAKRRKYPQLFWLLWAPAMVAFLLISHQCNDPDIVPEEQTVIVIEPSEMTLPKNLQAKYQLTVDAEGGDSGEEIVVIWSSTDSRVVTVDSAGWITPVMAGRADVVATRIDGKGEARCRITVEDNLAYKFRLVLKDKGDSEFTLANPEQFLSTKAIARRQKYNIEIDEGDLPISSIYLKQIAAIGGEIAAKSKWLGTVSVYCTDESLRYQYEELPFVKEVQLVWSGVTSDTGISATLDGVLCRPALHGTTRLVTMELHGRTSHWLMVRRCTKTGLAGPE